MGWIRKGKLVIPDGQTTVDIVNTEEGAATPSGLVVPNSPSSAPPPQPPREIRKQIKKFMNRQQKKQIKEANKRFLSERFSYLRSDRPESALPLRENKGE